MQNIVTTNKNTVILDSNWMSEKIGLISTRNFEKWCDLCVYIFWIKIIFDLENYTISCVLVKVGKASYFNYYNQESCNVKVNIMRILVTKYIALSLICKSFCMNKPRATRAIAFIIIVRR